jgi:hypothetical protein
LHRKHTSFPGILKSCTESTILILGCCPAQKAQFWYLEVAVLNRKHNSDTLSLQSCTLSTILILGACSPKQKA